MDQTVLSLLVQVPLVGLFIWFSLQQQKLHAESQAKRDADNLAIQNKRDEEWRIFLIEQRKANNEAVAEVAKELKENTVILASVQTTMTIHDQRVQLAIPSMQEVVKKLEDTQQRKGRTGS